MSSDGPQGLRSRVAPADVSLPPGELGSVTKEQLLRENVLLQEDNAFLRDYVTRCEAEMRAYQTQLPDFAAAPLPDALVDQGLPPWAANAKYMSPLLLAYEVSTLLPSALFS